MYFTQDLRDKLVNITPVSEGSALAWREARVWLGCRPFLKLTGDHEIWGNVHSANFYDAVFIVRVVASVTDGPRARSSVITQQVQGFTGYTRIQKTGK